MAEETKNTINVDGKDYDADSLSEQARRLISNIRYVDQELNRLQMQTAALQAGRQAYISTLKNELEKGDDAAAAE